MVNNDLKKIEIFLDILTSKSVDYDDFRCLGIRE